MAVELLALVSALAFAGVGSAVGLKLLWLARRTRRLPETLAGAALFLLAGVAWPLLLVVGAGNTLPAAWLRAAGGTATVALSLGWSGVLFFTWHVFRPGPGWGRTLARLGIAVELAAGTAGAIRALTLEDIAQFSQPTPSGLVLVLVAQAVYAWTTLESLRYRALLRRRIPLGLADPLVADRFGLWAWTFLFSFVTLVPSVVANFTGGDTNGVTSRLVVGVFGLLASLTLYLAFLPPAAYVRFVREGGLSVEAAGF